MSNEITSVYIDSELKKKAKELGINISDNYESFLRLTIGEINRKKDISPEVLKEIIDFKNDLTKQDGTMKPNWKLFLTGRAKLIFNKTGIEISPQQLEEEIEKLIK